MNCKAILSNKAHPEYGQATVPFPIPDSEYDHTIALLEAKRNRSVAAPVLRMEDRMKKKEHLLQVLIYRDFITEIRMQMLQKH